MTVIEYVREEVERQGHDTTVQDGIERVAWMLEAWRYALISNYRKPEWTDAEMLGRLVERDKNQDGFRRCGVRVGPRICPPHTEIIDRLERIWQCRDTMTPLEFYREFEEIHPFVDGNGRTGKILLNWLNGTLHNPIFPPADFWGKPIRNP